MNIEEINKDLRIIYLKHKLQKHLKEFIKDNDFNLFYLFLEKLKIKYTDDFNVIEQIRCNINNKIDLYIINGYIYNLTNENLLKDLLIFFDIGSVNDISNTLMDIKKISINSEEINIENSKKILLIDENVKNIIETNDK